MNGLNQRSQAISRVTAPLGGRQKMMNSVEKGTNNFRETYRDRQKIKMGPEEEQRGGQEGWPTAGKRASAGRKGGDAGIKNKTPITC
jgi:hypothetical protein